jgi:hypothetical protein
MEVFSMLKKNLQYYESQQCSNQWRTFLAAFSAEFASKGEVSDLRAFMYQMGRTMAAAFPALNGSSLQVLEDGINSHWSQIDWGWVELIEQAESLVVEHHASPLKVAFGEDALVWSSALLEGVYAQLFDNLGMDKSLCLTQRGDALEDGQLFVFELKKQLNEPTYFTRR